MSDPEFRIPKISVPIVCNTLQGEKISGEIFLDYLSSNAYTIDQLLDFFNADPPFIPVRTNISPRPILLQKNTIVSVDLVQMKNQLQESTSVKLAEKREAIFYLQATGPVRGSVILELPLDHARIIDLLNQKRMFIPVQIHEKFMLLNSHHINKIEEL